MKCVLFLCTGNYYRSRFAEELFNHLAPAECPGWRAQSRGIAIDLGVNNVGPIARAAAQALEKRGVGFDARKARFPMLAETADLESADHIVALKQAEHLPLLRQRFPSWLLSGPGDRVEYWHVDDVDQTVPEQALPLIAEQLQSLIARLTGKTPA